MVPDEMTTSFLDEAKYPDESAGGNIIEGGVGDASGQSNSNVAFFSSC